MLLLGESGKPEYTTGKKKPLVETGDCFSKVPRSQMLLNCNPLPLKRWAFNMFLMKENRRGLQSFMAYNLGVAKMDEGNCGTRNRPEKFRDFWERGPRAENQQAQPTYSVESTIERGTLIIAPTLKNMILWIRSKGEKTPNPLFATRTSEFTLLVEKKYRSQSTPAYLGLRLLFWLGLQLAPGLSFNLFIFLQDRRLLLLNAKYVTIEGLPLLIHRGLAPPTGMVTKRRTLQRKAHKRRKVSVETTTLLTCHTSHHTRQRAAYSNLLLAFSYFIDYFHKWRRI